MKKLSKAKLRKSSPIIGAVFATLIVGVVIGAVLFSNQIDQNIEVIDTENALTVVLVDGISSGSFRGVSLTTTFNITKNVVSGLSAFGFYILIDHPTVSLIVADVTVAVNCYADFRGSTPYLSHDPIPAKDFSTGNGNHYFLDSIGLAGSQYVFYEISITFESSAPAGTYLISVYCMDSIP